MTVETAVLIETLVELGADVRWLAVIFSPLKIMLQPRLQKQVFQSLRGKESLLKNTGGVLFKH